MKKLILICGANGIGKTSAAHCILNRLPHSAYVDSDTCRMMNPFRLDDTTIPTVAANIAALLRNYLLCSQVETVLFTYGFHGRRREVFSMVMDMIRDIPHEWIPILLVCSREENLQRMLKDGRDPDRVQRALDASRDAYSDVDYPILDTSHWDIRQTAEKIAEAAGLMLQP